MLVVVVLWFKKKKDTTNYFIIEEYRRKTRNVLFSRILSNNGIWWEKLRTIDCGVYSREKNQMSMYYYVS
jgi:hypothetical protein